MPQYQLVSRQAFAGKFWRRSAGYAFAASDTVCALLAQEMPNAVMHMPIAFVLEGEQFVPVALQGLQAGQNAFVAADGRWLLPYIPAAYRGYPFAAVRADNDQYVLCFDMDSGLLGDSGESFFAEDGSPAPFINEVAQFLQSCEQNRSRTLQQATLLKQLGLLTRWPIVVKDGDQEKPLDGIYCIDEAALNALPAEQFERLRQADALVMVYCQLLSRQHLPMLADKLRQQAAIQQQLAASRIAKDLDLSFMNSGDTLSFGTF